MEWIGIGIMLAIGFYIAPFVLGVIGILFAMVISIFIKEK